MKCNYKLISRITGDGDELSEKYKFINWMGVYLEIN